MACQTCEGCNSCDLCQVCDMSCNGVGGCLNCESFCQNGNQIVNSNFYWRDSDGNIVTTNTNDRIFTRDTWNSLANFINKAYKAGTEQSASSRNVVGLETGDYITAEQFTNLSKALFGLGGNDSIYPQRTVYGIGSQEKPEGDVVYGSYFFELQNQAQNLRYKMNQCNSCNLGCNNCDSCEGCNTCQINDTKYECCETDKTK